MKEILSEFTYVVDKIKKPNPCIGDKILFNEKLGRVAFILKITDDDNDLNLYKLRELYNSSNHLNVSTSISEMALYVKDILEEDELLTDDIVFNLKLIKAYVLGILSMSGNDKSLKGDKCIQERIRKYRLFIITIENIEKGISSKSDLINAVDFLKIIKVK